MCVFGGGARGQGPKRDPFRPTSLARSFRTAAQQVRFVGLATGERDLKIKFITLKTKPGQTMDEALQQALEQEMERMRLSAEEAALRQGKTLKEARKAGEEAAAKSVPWTTFLSLCKKVILRPPLLFLSRVKSEPAIEAKDMDELIQGLMGILSDFVGENPEELVDQLLLQGKDSGKGSNEDDEYVDKGIADHQDDNSVTDDEYLDPHEEL